MPRRPSPAIRTTLYRLTRLDGHLLRAVRARYLETDSFHQHPLTIGQTEALLVAGQMVTQRAKWTERIQHLTGTDLDIGNATAAGLLLVRDPEDAHVVWALSYGMGFQLIEQRYIDAGFGYRTALRAADPKAVRSLTRTTLDHRSRTDRSSIPSGDQLRTFDVGGFGELVTRLVASARIPELTHDHDSLTLRAADSLSVPLGRTANTLLADLATIRGVLLRHTPPDFALLEQLAPVKAEGLLQQLNAGLRATLAGEDDNGRLALAWPHERFDENGTPTTHKYYGSGRANSGPFDDVPQLADILERVAGQPDPLASTRTLKIQLFRDEDAQETISRAIPALKWLAYERDYAGGGRYCFHDGHWYQMDQHYAEQLRQHVNDIFARDARLAMPDWPDHMDEQEYNNAAAQHLRDAVVLDRNLIRTTQHPRGIEACDLLTADTMVHVKKIAKSSSASHVLAQAYVATDALLYDEEARAQLRARLPNAGAFHHLLGDPPMQIAVALARHEPDAPLFGPETLFTFTQVTLVRLDRDLRARGVTLYVLPIRRI